MGLVKLQVYGTDWCPLSLGFRKYFQSQQIAFEWHNLEQDPRAEAATKAMNGGELKFPMVVIGEVASYWQVGDSATVLKNPKLSELRAALEQHGLLGPDSQSVEAI
jgi:mycoredoxin